VSDYKQFCLFPCVNDLDHCQKFVEECYFKPNSVELKLSLAFYFQSVCVDVPFKGNASKVVAKADILTETIY